MEGQDIAITLVPPPHRTDEEQEVSSGNETRPKDTQLVGDWIWRRPRCGSWREHELLNHRLVTMIRFQLNMAGDEDPPGPVALARARYLDARHTSGANVCLSNIKTRLLPCLTFVLEMTFSIILLTLPPTPQRGLGQRQDLQLRKVLKRRRKH